MEENIYCCVCGKILFVNSTLNSNNQYTQVCNDCQNEKIEVNEDASMDSNDS